MIIKVTMEVSKNTGNISQEEADSIMRAIVNGVVLKFQNRIDGVGFSEDGYRSYQVSKVKVITVADVIE